ncbi:MAG: LVIVD repeat-containing protein [Candidatus Hodarchaeota archaeon]
MPLSKRIKVLTFICSIVVISGAIGVIFLAQQPVLNVGYEVFVQGDYAYVTNNDGTKIIDVTNPSNPRSSGIISTSDGAFGVTAKDDLLYIASDSNGFIVANVSDPENPLILDQFNDGGSANSVCINGSYAYVTEYPQGMEIFDISTYTNIIKITEYDDGGEFRDVAIKNDFIYLADSARGLKVLDVTNPSSPELVSDSLLTHGAISVQIHNDLLFLGCHRFGVYIFNISIPHSPIQLGKYYKIEGEAYGVSGNSTHLYVADLQQGVYLLDISNPAQPSEIVSYNNAHPHDIFYDGEYVYLADQDRELFIFETDLTLIYRGEISLISHLNAIPSFEFFSVLGGFISLVLILRKRKN